MEIILMLGTIIVIGASLVYAMNKNDEEIRHHPDRKSYTWGYFFGMFGLIANITVLVLITLLTVLDVMGYPAIQWPYEMTYIQGTILGAIGAVAHYHTIKRNKVAFIIATVTTLSIIVVIFNFFYIKNRWNELEPIAE